MTASAAAIATAAVAVNGPEGELPDWDQVDWGRAEQKVRRLRQRIFAASQAGDLAKVRNLQKLMLRSRSNALVSVRRVTEVNAGRRTAGVDLVHGSGLSGASQSAYAAGLASAIRVGPFGDVPGASKLVRVRFLDPVYHAEAMTVGLRWEATGLAGGLFPVLDADISLAPDGERKTRLALAGAYRPLLGRFGSGLDRAILNRVAVATIRALLRSIADALASPEAAAEMRDTNGKQSRPADLALAGPGRRPTAGAALTPAQRP